MATAWCPRRRRGAECKTAAFAIHHFFEPPSVAIGHTAPQAVRMTANTEKVKGFDRHVQFLY
mgnify:CR=1 FL=1